MVCSSKFSIAIKFKKSEIISDDIKCRLFFFQVGFVYLFNVDLFYDQVFIHFLTDKTLSQFCVKR